MFFIIQRLFVIVGTPGSGKDLLIRAVDDLGTQHAQIVPKHTTRKRQKDDRNEMICSDDPGYNLDACGIKYQNYGDTYGIEPAKIWEGLRRGVFQVVVVSNVEAINRLREIFGELMVLVYVHSEVDAEEYQETETAKDVQDAEYVKHRVAEYRLAFDVYLRNVLAFDHVLIYSRSGLREDLYDQIFRLFRAYERGDLHRDSAESLKLQEQFWAWLVSQKPPRIIGGYSD